MPVISSLSPSASRFLLVQAETGGDFQRARSVGRAALRIDLAVERVELLGRAQFRDRKLDAGGADRGDAQYRIRHQHQPQLRIALEHLAEIGGRHPAEGTIEIVEPDQRFLALGVADHDHAGKPVDRSK